MRGKLLHAEAGAVDADLRERLYQRPVNVARIELDGVFGGSAVERCGQPVGQIDEPVRQIQASELVDDAVQVEPIVGRGRRRRALPTSAMGVGPEADELVRADPDLLELVEDTAVTAPSDAAKSS